MMETLDLHKIQIWPVQQALKVQDTFPNQERPYIFETGYGPSGLPHIGTFAEVVRTNMVMQTFQKYFHHPSKLIAFSDDMDGLRKVPSNIPNQDHMEKEIKIPICHVTDPFGCHTSFADHNISKFLEFLDSIPGLTYTSLRASQLYTSGFFDQTLLLFLKNYRTIMDVILPTLRSERRKTYSIFLPISKIDGTVLEVPTYDHNTTKGTLVYKDIDGKEVETSILGGNCKLQWKADFAMRWIHLGVNYEMCGKDVNPSFTLSAKILHALGYKAPVNLTYELFLDEQGHKISKSKGNEEITMESWTTYAPIESLSYFMYGRPERAKKLTFSVIPKSTDEYLSFLSKLQIQNQAEDLLKNPAYFVHHLNIPHVKPFPFDYSLLLNLASVSNASSEDILWKFLQRYNAAVSFGQEPLWDELVKKAVLYYQNFIEPYKEFLKPNTLQKVYLQRLYDGLNPSFDRNQVEIFVYDLGKQYIKELQDLDDQKKVSLALWFSVLYETLLGQKTGPRMGSFIVIFGIDAMKQRILEVLA